MGIFFLPIIYILSERLYNVVEILQHAGDLVLVVLCILLPYTTSDLSIQFIKRNKLFLGFLAFCFFFSVITAYFNFSQSVMVGSWASRIFLIYILLFFTLFKLIKTISLSSIYKFVLLTSIYLIAFNFYIYLSGDFQYYFGNVVERFEDKRFLVGGTSIIYFYLYLLSHKDSKTLALPVGIGLLLTVAIVAKTRSLLFPLMLITVLPFINFKKVKNIGQMILIFSIIAFSSFIAGDNLFVLQVQNLFELSANDVAQGGGNISFRLFTVLYFLENMNIPSIIFGYGMEVDRLALYYERFYLSDVGMFKIFYYHGLLGLGLYFALLKRFYYESSLGDSPLHKFGRYIVYFQFAAPTLTILYTITGMLFFFTTYFYLTIVNQQQNA